MDKKVGERVIIKNDVKTDKYVGQELIAKAGSKGFVTQDGSIYLTTGNAQHRLIKTDMKPTELDLKSIAGLIFERMESEIEMDFHEMLESNGIENDRVIGIIEGVLEDIF